MDDMAHMLGPTTGTSKLLRYFGYLPTFRGTVISRVVMSSEGPWIAMEFFVNDLVHPSTIVCVIFSGVRDCELHGFGYQNTIRLYETEERDGKALTRIESADGLGGYILSDTVRIESVKKA